MASTIDNQAKETYDTRAATEILVNDSNEIDKHANNTSSLTENMNEVIERNFENYKSNLKIDDATKKNIEYSLELTKQFIEESNFISIYAINQENLSELQKKNNKFELVSLVDSKGLAIKFSKDIGSESADVSYRPFYKECIKGNDYVSKPYISIATNNYCITVAMPVKYENEILGVIVVDIEL